MYLCLVVRQHKHYILSFAFLAFLFCSPGLAQEESRKIGLLLRDSNCTGEMKVAAAVIKAANAKLSENEPKFELVIRTVEGPWGAGSKESVSLVYEDSVLLYLGALDGGNAHLAEQVAAKAHMAYIETRATEPTLTQAYVPWFVRVVPNDNQQAEILAKAISEAGGGDALILSRDNTDNRYAVQSLVKAGAKAGNVSPVILEWKRDGKDYNDMFGEISQMEPVHLMLTFWSEDVFRLSRDLWKLHPEIKLYANLDFMSGLQQYPGPVHIPGSMTTTTTNGYLDYLSDGLKLAVEAICTCGKDSNKTIDRDILKNCIPGMKLTEAKTGPISFDELGNRITH